MLKLLFGASGTGKTHTVFQEIHMLSQDENCKILLIVPEQFSFETERNLLEFLGARLFARVEVYSFTRLCHQMLELYGGSSLHYADPIDKILLMNLTLREVSDALEHYKRAALSSNFISSALRTVDELKTNGVTPALYEEALAKLGTEVRSKKLDELSLIYSAYQGLLGRSFQDEMDDYAKALEHIKASSHFNGYSVFVDEFKGFTKPQYDVLEQLLIQSSSCTVSLCADYDRKNEMLFTCIKDTADRLQNLARKHEISVAVSRNLTQNRRFENEELTALESNLFRSDLPSEPFSHDHISVFKATNEYEEVDYALSKLLSWVQKGQIRFRDSIIMCRKLDSYQKVLIPALQKYHIPYFLDGEYAVENFPPARLAVSLLRSAAANYDSDELLGALKCYMLPFELEEISLLENYVFLWDIKGSKWSVPFLANPRGFEGELNSDDKKTLEQLNSMRVRIIEPLSRFIRDTQSVTAGEICRAFYRLLQELKAIEALELRIKEFSEKGDHVTAAAYTRVWDVIVEILDAINTVAGNIAMDRRRFLELFELAIQNSKMADPPQSLDCIMIGSPERSRSDSVKALIVLGANEGVFPYLPVSNTLLKDNERELLTQAGLELQGDSRKKLLEERYVVYKTLTLPSEELLLTFREANIKGETQQPSDLIEHLSALFSSDIVVEHNAVSPLYYCRTSETAFLQYAFEYSGMSDFKKTMEHYFGGNQDYAEKLRLLKESINPAPYRISDKALSEQLFGKAMHLSPSRVEVFSHCSFAYFCRYGLKAEPRRKAELNPMERGTVIHDILYQFISNHSETMFDLGEPEVRRLVSRYLDDYIERVMGGSFDKTKRFLAIYYRLCNTITKIILRLIGEFKQSEFVPTDFELEIGSSEDVKPTVLKTADGRAVVIHGTIDRVDMCNIDGQKYVRVVDYKSGAKLFRFSDVYYGFNLQMILYLFTIWKNGRNKYENTLPAGVLYMPAGDLTPDLDRDATSEDVSRHILSSYKMNGFVLEESDVITAMEPDAKGIFIPVQTSKDGSYSKASSLIKLEELGKLEQYVSKLVIHMAEELFQGNVDAVPSFSAGSINPCEYCDYSSVCRRKNVNKRAKGFDNISKDELFQRIGEGEVKNAGLDR